ncbi:oligosaccharide flippase family protein [Pseudomonas sp. Fl5BN2]|uniref:flippase n=1 Tax=Pseudomonas sp. Fl5BN2 TaxID=2697652 RepID=UPI001377647A|nr:flippase [Pseudomonas sp. Fl5BN2]NBF03288.1 oligosaccharide flippase family protein [Pseudomonas sp. Fl5BN2]
MSQTDHPVWLRLLPLALRKRLAGRVNILSIIHNSGWLLLDKFTRMFLGLLVGAWVARYLGPSEYGELAYVIAYIAFFQAVATLGLDGIVIREISRDKEISKEVLGTSFTLRMYAGIACWLVAVGSLVIIDGWNSPTVLIAALAGGTLIFQAADTIDLWFQSQGQNRRTVIAKLIAYLASNILKVVLILLKAPLVAFALAISLDIAISAAGLFFAYKKFPCDGHWCTVKSKALELLRECWPFILSGLAVIIYMRIDQVMIKEILGAKSLGIYSAILPIAMAPNFIPTIMSVVLMPIISRLYNEDRKKYHSLLIFIFRVNFYAALFIALCVAALSDLIVSILFGPDFMESSTVLRIYIFSNCFTWLGIAHSLWLVNEKRGMVRLYGTVLGALSCVILNFLLIPLYGLKGAAFVAIIAQFISAVGVNLFFAKESFILQAKGILFLKREL